MRILLADDHPLILDGFKQHLSEIFPDCSIGTAMSLAALKKDLAENVTDVLFQDVQFGKDDAREFIGEIRSAYPDMKIIGFSTFEDTDIIKRLFAMGINGYVLKSEDRAEINNAIEAVLKNQKYISKQLSFSILDHTIMHASEKKAPLTKREKEVLKLILAEKSTKEIGEALFLSAKTIENYRAALFIKFDVKNVVGLVKKALLQGYS